MKSTSFATQNQSSPLMQTQWLKHAGEVPGKKKTDGNVLLPLTSLIDAFSIIVIYLLIGTQGGGLEKDIPAQLQLPVAAAGDVINTEMLTIKIIQGRYYINDQYVSLAQLGAELNQAKNSFAKDQKAQNVELLVQADQAMDYAQLDPILRAGSEAGIQKLKFAVLPKQ